MGRRVVVAPEPHEEVGTDEIDFDDMDVPSSSTDEAEIASIIEGIASRSPRKLYEGLERSQTVGSRDLSVIYRALDDEDARIRDAYDLSFIAKCLAAKTKNSEKAIVARCRMEADQHAPRKTTAKGEPKALTVDERKDYYRSHPDVVAVRNKLVEHEAFAEHCERLAMRRSFRPKTLETLLDAARATGTGVTSGYSEDD